MGSAAWSFELRFELRARSLFERVSLNTSQRSLAASLIQCLILLAVTKNL